MSSRTPGRAPEHTMLIKAPTFSKSGRAWRPFTFNNLEKVSKRHALLIKNLEWMWPNVRATGEVSSSVQKRLEEMLEEQISMRVEYVHVVPMSQLQHYIGETTFLAVLTPQPNKTRGLLEVDARYRTAQPNVYAVGDVIGPPSLASTMFAPWPPMPQR